MHAGNLVPQVKFLSLNQINLNKESGGWQLL